MPKKKKKWPLILAICVGVGAVAVWGVSSFFSKLRPSIPENVLTATAQGAVIDSTVVGTGTLGYADADTVSIPNGVDVTSIFCQAGQTVSSGELLAAVDPKSCEVLMSETYAEIAAIEERMRQTPSEPELLQITAPVSGQVETVSIHEGSSVMRALAASSSLLTISPTGRLGAQIQCTNPPQAGTDILVTFPDGSQQSAAVESITHDAFSVVLDAKGQETGTQVEAKNKQGEVLGSGTLVAMDAVSVVAPAGTVKDLKVQPGARVDAGSALFSVRCAEPPAAYQALEQERATLTKRYDALNRIHQDGGLISPVGGTVISCSLQEGEQSASGMSPNAQTIPFSPQDAMEAFGMTGMNRGRMAGEHTDVLGIARGGENIMLSASDDASPEVQPDEPPEQSPSAELSPEPSIVPTAPPAPSASQPTDVPTAPPAPSTSQPTDEPLEPRPIPRLTVPLIPPIPGLPLQHRLDLLPLFQGEVSWTPEDEQAAFSTVYTAHVSLRALDGFYFAKDCSVTLLGADAADVTIETADGVSTLSFSATYEKTMSALSFPDVDWSKLQDILGGASLDLNSLGKLLGSGVLPEGALNFDPSALYAGAGFDPSALYDPSAFGSGLPEGASAYGTYLNPDETAACTIAADDRMQLTIEINQMDILSVHPGMACKISVDALEGKEYDGTVEDVAAIGNTAGTYTATIELERSDGMLSGMTASAVITTSETDSSVTIPVAALQEDGNRVFVYTSYADGAFGGERDVRAGVSNGQTVEITEGLETGDIVYYAGESFMSRMMRMMNGQSEDAPTSVPEVAAVETQTP